MPVRFDDFMNHLEPSRKDAMVLKDTISEEKTRSHLSLNSIEEKITSIVSSSNSFNSNHYKKNTSIKTSALRSVIHNFASTTSFDTMIHMKDALIETNGIPQFQNNNKKW